MKLPITIQSRETACLSFPSNNKLERTQNIPPWWFGLPYGKYSFRYRKIVAKIFFPFVFFKCERCSLSFNIIEGHTTQYTEGIGCFPLCQPCWEELEIPEARWPYYIELINDWIVYSNSPESMEDIFLKRKLIKIAVMKGK